MAKNDHVKREYLVKVPGFSINGFSFSSYSTTEVSSSPDEAFTRAVAHKVRGHFASDRVHQLTGVAVSSIKNYGRPLSSYVSLAEPKPSSDNSRVNHKIDSTHDLGYFTGRVFDSASANPSSLYGVSVEITPTSGGRTVMYTRHATASLKVPGNNSDFLRYSDKTPLIHHCDTEGKLNLFNAGLEFTNDIGSSLEGKGLMVVKKGLDLLVSKGP